jgi:hypothetical protein
MNTAISLGWNCESAMKGVSMGIRATKKMVIKPAHLMNVLRIIKVYFYV